MTSLPPSAGAWSTTKRLDAGAATLRLDVSEPADLCLSLDFGFATIVATGVEDVGDLIEAFRLQDEDRVSCHRYGFALEEHREDSERWVVYRDKRVEVRIARRDYDRIAAAVTDLVASPPVQSAIEHAYARHATVMREAAWHSGSVEC